MHMEQVAGGEGGWAQMTDLVWGQDYHEPMLCKNDCAQVQILKMEQVAGAGGWARMTMSTHGFRITASIRLR